MYQVPPATTLGRKPLNPWLSMWTQPRGTVRAMLDSTPQWYVLLLAALAGINQALSNAASQSLGDTLSLAAIVIGSLAVGPIFGIIQLYIAAAMMRLTGSWFGGVASISEMRTAIAWSMVPTIWMLGLWVPELVLFGEELFTAATPTIDAQVSLAIAMLLFGVMELVLGVWSTVVFLKSVAEAHAFSAWRALGASIVAVLILVVPIIVILLAAI